MYGTKPSPWGAWGTPSMLGDMDVPPFLPPFLTFWGLNSIFLGYFFSSTNTKMIFGVLKLLIVTEFDLFGPKFHFSLHLFGSNFQRPAAPPPSVFGPSTPPPPPRCKVVKCLHWLQINFVARSAKYILYTTCVRLTWGCLPTQTSSLPCFTVFIYLFAHVACVMLKACGLKIHSGCK